MGRFNVLGRCQVSPSGQPGDLCGYEVVYHGDVINPIPWYVADASARVHR